eukprot:2103286-Prymnesium_polylepis.1
MSAGRVLLSSVVSLEPVAAVRPRAARTLCRLSGPAIAAGLAGCRPQRCRAPRASRMRSDCWIDQLRLTIIAQSIKYRERVEFLTVLRPPTPTRVPRGRGERRSRSSKFDRG